MRPRRGSLAGANSHFGPVRLTHDPSGHCFASFVHPVASPGQAANSQLGPLRPTYEPSGHSFASSVQAVGPLDPGQGANSHFGPVRPTDVPSGQISASSVHPPSGAFSHVRIVHMMPRSVHEHSLHPSSEGKSSPRLYCASRDGVVVTAPGAASYATVSFHEQVCPSPVGEPSFFVFSSCSVFPTAISPPEHAEVASTRPTVQQVTIEAMRRAMTSTPRERPLAAWLRFA